MYVHCSTVYNSKDLVPTQMPINDRLDQENMAHIHHGILCSHKKQWVCALCGDMDESGNCYSQQTDTKQKIKHCMFSLIGRCWTMGTHGHREGNITHWGLLWWGVLGKGQQGVGRLGWDNMGRNARYMWWGDGGSKPPYRVCTYATILRDLDMYPRT